MKITIHTLGTADILQSEKLIRPLMLPAVGDAYDKTPHPGNRAAMLGTALMQWALLGVRDESQLEVGEFGKPTLVGGPAHNFSNADGLVVLGVAEGPSCTTVGVDVERVERSDEHVVRNYFTQEEAAWLHEAGEDEEPRRFCHLWTRLEARLKAEGCGFGIDPRRHPEILDGWECATFDLGPHVVSCAARQTPEPVVVPHTTEDLLGLCQS